MNEVEISAWGNSTFTTLYNWANKRGNIYNNEAHRLRVGLHRMVETGSASKSRATGYWEFGLSSRLELSASIGVCCVRFSDRLLVIPITPQTQNVERTNYRTWSVGDLIVPILRELMPLCSECHRLCRYHRTMASDGHSDWDVCWNPKKQSLPSVICFIQHPIQEDRWHAQMT
jgi:hypothetical protein